MKTINGTELMQMSFPPRDDIVEDLIPKGLSLLVGKPKSGKSVFALQLCVAVAEGRQMLGRNTPEGEVLLLALEDHYARLQERLLAMGANEEHSARIQIALEVDEARDTERFVAKLEKWHASCKNPRLIVVDVLAHVSPEQKTSGRDYENWVQFLAQLRAFAAKHDIGILLVHHTSKRDGTSDRFDSILGSTGIFATVDTALLMDIVGNDTASISLRSRDVGVQELHLRHSARELGWELTDGEPAPKSDRGWRQDEVLRLISKAGAPMSLSDIREATGTSSSNMVNVLNALIARGEVVRLPKGHYGLPEVNWGDSEIERIVDKSEVNEPEVHAPDAEESDHDMDERLHSEDLIVPF